MKFLNSFHYLAARGSSDAVANGREIRRDQDQFQFVRSLKLLFYLQEARTGVRRRGCRTLGYKADIDESWFDACALLDPAKGILGIF